MQRSGVDVDEGARGNGVLKQSVDESWIASRPTGVYKYVDAGFGKDKNMKIEYSEIEIEMFGTLLGPALFKLISFCL